MTDAIRTPDELLEDLPGFPWAPHYRQVDGLRLAHVDEGDGAPVVMWHGEPTWGYLWRKVAARAARGRPPRRAARPGRLRPLRQADRPGWYTYDRHVAMAATLLEDLDLRGATFVVHDWGGPIGLRLAVEHRERVDRLVIMDTGLLTGRQADERGVAHVRRLRAPGRGAAGRLPRPARLPRRPRRRGGGRLRRAVPQRGLQGRRARVPGADPARVPAMAGAEAGQRTLDALREDTRPMLMLWGRRTPRCRPPSARRSRARSAGRRRGCSRAPATSCRRTGARTSAR